MEASRRRAETRAFALKICVACAALLVLLTPGRASAYPWMVRHTYQQCTPCHADPAGSGPLTTYGRAMGEELLRMKYPLEEQGDDMSAGNFLWGVPLPEWLMLGGDV